jgi:hypothetical protein
MIWGVGALLATISIACSRGNLDDMGTGAAGASGGVGAAGTGGAAASGFGGADSPGTAGAWAGGTGGSGHGGMGGASGGAAGGGGGGTGGRATCVPPGTSGGAGAGGVNAMGGRGGAGGGGRGGSSGGATGGAAGQGYNDLTLPDCVTTLIASCATAGMCTAVRPGGGATSDIYFASGVHVAYTGALAKDGDTQVLNVTNADGSPCYSFETTWGHVVPNMDVEMSYTWRDPAGRVVATGSTFSIDLMTSTGITCTSGAHVSCQSRQTSSVGPPTPCCTLGSLGNAACVTSQFSCSVYTCP